jgi:hypothetical protein
METALVQTYPNGHDSTGVIESENPTPAIRIISAGQTLEGSEGQISTEDLYSNFENVSLELKTADRIISDCLEHTQRAIAAHRDGELIMADDAMQSVQGLIPELFCCRSLGEGFGIIINGILCAFQNLAGAPLGREQVDSIRRTFQSLRAEPFVSAEIAVDKLGELERVGLKVEPPEFHILADLLDEQSLR